jgi:membrane protein implicated in regulation of membrane protease activity
MLLRCGTRMMGGTAAAMGGMAMLAAAAPFLAGVGLGAAAVCGALAARKAVRRRTAWRDEAAAGHGSSDPAMPDEGEATGPAPA